LEASATTDIGGTSSRLATFEVANGNVRMLETQTYASARFGNLSEILDVFMVHREQPLAACFGAAGPVHRGSVRTPNLKWIVGAQSLARQSGLAKIALINDLEANAWGIRQSTGEALPAALSQINFSFTRTRYGHSQFRELRNNPLHELAQRIVLCDYR
jgi:glucokinase